MTYKPLLPIVLCLVLLSSALSACVSGGVIEIGVEPATPTVAGGSSSETPGAAQPSATPSSTQAQPTSQPVPADRELYSNQLFGLQFLFPVDWYGPDEYAVDNVLRVTIGSDVVYPYGTDRTEQIYNLQNAYYITIQYSTNDQNAYWEDMLASLRNLRDGESLANGRSQIIRLQAFSLGNFEGFEYISTLSEEAQTEPVYTREIILVDEQSNLLTISGSPNNVDLSAGSGWRAAYQAVDEANQDLFHEITASIVFKKGDSVLGNDEQGLLRGTLCYPSEFIPPMHVFFKNTASGQLHEILTVENQAEFEISLPGGSYYAFAYLVSEPQMGGAYTNAVACGLSETCRDHSLLAVEIGSQAATEGIGICDFYAPEFIPANPYAIESADPLAAGLIYRWVLGQFRVDADGQGYMLAGMQSMPSYSPDGKQAVFAKDDDIWLVNFEDHSVRNLTNTPDRIEREPQWWPANPNAVVFGSASLAQGYEIMSGHLSVVAMDGNGYQVLSPDFIGNTTPALSPDGATIAHENGADLWLYNLADNTNARVDLTAYGLSGTQQLGSPAWSADGSKLALWVGGQFVNGNWGVGLAIIDFVGGTALRMHTYEPVGSGGWLPTPRWSPDSAWLAAMTRGENGKGGLWLLKADGTSEINLGNSAEPAWSPDGQLAYVEWGEGDFTNSKVFLLTPGESRLQLNLKPGSVPVFWISR